MNLKSVIRPELWTEISNSYIAENYKSAIIDAMRYLSQIIREKSGLDGDGIPLVGQAFGGDEPKLRLNKLQTQSEKDEQKGFQLITSGLFSAIRNPRAHEDIQDNKNTADPIIYFINYILNVIDVAKPPFAIEDFLPRVFDKDFVEKQIYVSELIKEIPKNKYLETLIEIYRKKNDGRPSVIAYVSREIINCLTEHEIKQFIGVISAELDIVSNENTISTILRILPSQYWSMVKLTAKLRIENKLIESINSGQSPMYSRTCTSGGLGTWATRIIDQFTLREELIKVIISSLKPRLYLYSRYIFFYFLPYLPNLLEDPKKHKQCLAAMKELIKYNDTGIKEKVMDFLSSCPENWLIAVRDEFLDWTDSENPESYLIDGSPFLGKVPYETFVIPTEEDDIPF